GRRVVSRAELLGLIVPLGPAPAEAPAPTRAQQARHTQAGLGRVWPGRRHGGGYPGGGQAPCLARYSSRARIPSPVIFRWWRRARFSTASLSAGGTSMCSTAFSAWGALGRPGFFLSAMRSSIAGVSTEHNRKATWDYTQCRQVE